MIIIATFSISEILIYESSGECESFQEDTFQIGVCMMRDEVVLHLAELAAIVICRITGVVSSIYRYIFSH